jgi:hypothetical protein
MAAPAMSETAMADPDIQREGNRADVMRLLDFDWLDIACSLQKVSPVRMTDVSTDARATATAAGVACVARTRCEQTKSESSLGQGFFVMMTSLQCRIRIVALVNRVRTGTLTLSRLISNDQAGGERTA